MSLEFSVSLTGRIPSTGTWVDTVSHLGADTADTDLQHTKYAFSQLATVSISTFMEKFGDQL